MSEYRGALRSTRGDGWMQRTKGHLWTVGPSLYRSFGERMGPESRDWQIKVKNDRAEPILRSGRLTEVEGSRTLVVILHGMGGTVERGYCLLAAQRARQLGMTSLRLALRGGDGVGKDLHHAGLVDDLGPILRRFDADRYRSVAIVGYSLGGHVALTAALKGVDERLGAVCAICPPLDLRAAQQAIDGPRGWGYRQYLLRGLKRAYRRIAEGAEVPTPKQRVELASTLREWDALTVVPRFGFRDVDHYYRSQSVGPKLKSMKIPALVVASPGDPLVPAASLRGHLAHAAPSVKVRWVHDGGHVFFPPNVELGLGGRPGVEAQIMQWICDMVS